MTPCYTIYFKSELYQKPFWHPTSSINSLKVKPNMVFCAGCLSNLLMVIIVATNYCITNVPRSVTYFGIEDSVKMHWQCKSVLHSVLPNAYVWNIHFHVSVLLDFTVVCMILLLVHFGLSDMCWVDMRTTAVLLLWQDVMVWACPYVINSLPTLIHTTGLSWNDNLYILNNDYVIMYGLFVCVC